MTNPNLKPAETLPTDLLAEANRRSARAAIDAENTGDREAVRRFVPPKEAAESSEPLAAAAAVVGQYDLNATAPDPYDPASLFLDDDIAGDVHTEKLLTSVRVGNPHPHDFVRVHPGPKFRIARIGLIRLGTDRDFYLVRPEIRSELVNETKPYILFTAVNQDRIIFLWPVRLPGPDGRENEYWRTARVAAEIAMTTWVRVSANTKLSAYDIVKAKGQLPDPEWPDYSLSDLLRIAFADTNRTIDRADHAVIRKLRGLA